MKKQSKKKKQNKVNIYAWANKNKKTFARVICILIVVAMLISMAQL